LGGLAGGTLYESLGSAGMFRWMGIGILAGLLIIRFVEKVSTKFPGALSSK
jgi:hypothetical protein